MCQMLEMATALMPNVRDGYSMYTCAECRRWLQHMLAYVGWRMDDVHTSRAEPIKPFICEHSNGVLIS